MRPTLHLVPRDVWASRDPSAPYGAASLESEGFIHCTDGAEELAAVANRYFRTDPRPFVAVTFDLDRAGSPWRIDVPGSPYPHVYGRVAPEAVIDVRDVPRGADGAFLPLSARGAGNRQNAGDDEAVKRTVADGYDRIAERYLEWGHGVRDDPRGRMLALFAARLPEGARVLDVGCGAGVPSTVELARRFHVTGVDISARQLEAARANVPGVTFIEGDIATMDFPDGSWDGVTAFYSISHIPRDQHASLFRQIARWLAPGGVFLATLGVSAIPDWTGPWLGVPMFFSSHDAGTNRRLLRDAGFTLLVDEVIEIHEPEGPVPFLWVLAQRAGAD